MRARGVFGRPHRPRTWPDLKFARDYFREQREMRDESQQRAERLEMRAEQRAGKIVVRALLSPPCSLC
jgi:hypothetical protein